MAFLYTTFTNAISTKSTFNGIEAGTMILCWWSPVTILYFVADYHALESILFGCSCGSICLWPCHNLSFFWKCTNMCLGAVLLCWVVCFESALYQQRTDLIQRPSFRWCISRWWWWWAGSPGVCIWQPIVSPDYIKPAIWVPLQVLL